MRTKICTKCKRELTINEFRKDKSKKDGLYSSCNDCYRKRAGHRKYKRELLGYYKNMPVYETETIYPLIKIAENKMVRAHRYIMEDKLGRKLEKREHVHHKDNNKKNWRPENLIILGASEHQKLHGKPRRTGTYRKCITCGKERYYTKYYMKHGHIGKNGIYQCRVCFNKTGGGIARWAK